MRGVDSSIGVRALLPSPASSAAVRVTLGMVTTRRVSFVNEIPGATLR